jgi:hypothetical protein
LLRDAEHGLPNNRRWASSMGMPGITKNVRLNIDSEADATVALHRVATCQLWVVKNFWAMSGIRFGMALQHLRGMGTRMLGAFLGTPESRPNSIASMFAGAI